MATDVFSAKTGSGTWGGATIEDLRNITVNRNVGENTYATSSTATKTKRTTGHSDSSGSFDVYTPATPAGPTAVLPFDEGDEDTLILLSSAAQTLFSATAVILTIEHSIPVEGGENVVSTVTFGQV